MKRYPLGVLLVFLSGAACLAEDATLMKNTVMRADRSLVSLKAGTVVEVLERGDKTASIRYKGQTGTIPLASLSGTSPEPAPSPTPVASVPPSPSPKPAAAKSLVADHPQSTYGALVKKAEANVAKHDANVAKPVNEATEDTPSK